MIWVPNQLVGAPAGTDVTVDCHTEAHPRAISYWVYDNVMVLPTKKYAINTEENSYRYVFDKPFDIFSRHYYLEIKTAVNVFLSF